MLVSYADASLISQSYKFLVHGEGPLKPNVSDGFGIIRQRCNRGWRASGPLRDVAGLPAHGSKKTGPKSS
ncbi:hypothetical protein WN944_007875 [Citrus x changshan-huyou]|uniref:Uncharacterized protein n=1 Tax=Citrus x changshan-huyou TaxID=2935761 RepID=A0AAP0MLW8_9ROSI